MIIPLFLLPSCDIVRGGIRLSLGRFPYCGTSSSSSSLGTTSSGTSRHTLCLLVSILCVVLRHGAEDWKRLKKDNLQTHFLLICDIRKYCTAGLPTVILTMTYAIDTFHTLSRHTSIFSRSKKQIYSWKHCRFISGQTDSAWTCGTQLPCALIQLICLCHGCIIRRVAYRL